MAKAKTETKPKALKSAKAKEPEATNAAVGPVAGTLEGEPDDVKAAPAPKTTKASKVAQDKLNTNLEGQFAEIRKTLEGTTDARKQPRQLRWALRALDAAEDAAKRHVQHNV